VFIEHFHHVTNRLERSSFDRILLAFYCDLASSPKLLSNVAHEPVMIDICNHYERRASKADANSPNAPSFVASI